MATEYGIFNNEGKIEGDFYSFESAVKAMAERYPEGDEVYVAECCPDHPEHERASCEECNADEAE
jgi:hypothetical protein